MSHNNERVEQFTQSVEALNKQFVEWFSSQVNDKPSKMLTTGVADYLRHSAKLRLAFSDVLAEVDDHSGSSDDIGLKKRPAYIPLMSLMPYCYTKTVHFIRHGEGYHNVGIANADAHLTSKGWTQAGALRKHMHKFDITRQVEIVVVSPLMRTLETAAGVFGEDTNHGRGTPQLLMVGHQEAPDVRSAHPPVHSRNGIRYQAHELCRERLGPSPCDSRRSRTEATQMFPAVDFSMIESDDDPYWQPGMVENEAEVATRGNKFLQFLMSLTETNVAVVTHSAFLWFTLAMFGGDAARPVRNKLQKWYENCEMRTLVLSDSGGAGVVDETHFQGGHAAVEPQGTLLEKTV